MEQPTSKKVTKTLPNHSIGLNSDKLDDMNVGFAVFSYVHKAPEAPAPKGSVGACDSMRKRILQLSLFPDIYDKRGNTGNPGNVDFGH